MNKKTTKKKNYWKLKYFRTLKKSICYITLSYNYYQNLKFLLINLKYKSDILEKIFHKKVNKYFQQNFLHLN